MAGAMAGHQEKGPALWPALYLWSLSTAVALDRIFGELRDGTSCVSPVSSGSGAEVSAITPAAAGEPLAPA
jgi:hypothetical protein